MTKISKTGVKKRTAETGNTGLNTVNSVPCKVPGCHGTAYFRPLPGGKKGGVYKCSKCLAEQPVL